MQITKLIKNEETKYCAWDPMGDDQLRGLALVLLPFPHVREPELDMHFHFL